MNVRTYGNLGPGSPTLLWVHGGSWIQGSVEEWHPALLSLASCVRGTVIGVRYRLSSEAHHPAPVCDVVSAVNAVRTVIGPDAPLVIGGDSAGGTLAASASLRVSREIDGQVLAYPPFDPLCAGASFDEFAGEFPSRRQLSSAWASYAGAAPDASGIPLTPLAYPDLSVAPPVSLIVGTEDPVRSDVVEYASRLKDSGVSVRLSETDLIRHGDFLSPTRAMVHPLHTWIADEANHYFTEGTP